MARFDFIESAASGYRFLMLEHKLIYQMALVPFLVKLASFALITAFDLQTNFLRQGLVLLPSYFVEGFLIAQLIRLAVYKEAWPASLSGDQKKDEALFKDRSRSILSAAIIYVLIKMVLAFATGTALDADAIYQNASSTPEPSALMFLSAFIAMGFLIWSFRLLWLYVPVAMGRSVTGFLRRIKPFSVSIYMLATWILCFTPMALLLIMISEVVVTVFPPLESGEPSMAFRYVMIFGQAALEITISIVSSVAIAYGIAAIYKNNP